MDTNNEEGHIIEGVPGHVAWKGWARELQKNLKKYGIPFEAELDHTRIHFKGLLMQIYPDTSGYVIDASLPLPLGGEDPEYLEEILEGYRLLLLLVSSSQGTRPSYELDTSLPYNPTLHTILFFSDPYTLINVVENFLEKATIKQESQEP